ncbi:hypothetical protein [Crocosphaera sp. Alani8]|uniref:hypothetical protein n=1 Tax=Crocosphaera sp. Alani8 TaxID=3038952 RepID=UPI00313E1BED
MEQPTQEHLQLSRKRQQLILTYKPNDDNPDYYWIELLKERKAERGITPKESILEAARAFWMPIACSKSQQYSSDCLTEMFWESIAKLNAQQELLWNTVGKSLNLERPPTTVETQWTSSNNNNPPSLNNDSKSTPNKYSGCNYNGVGLL